MEKSGNNRKDAMTSFVNNAKPRYHLIPPTYKYKGGVLDFQNIITVKVNELNNINKKATLALEFMKDIRCRFSAYYARQGQPQLDTQEVLDILEKTN